MNIENVIEICVAIDIAILGIAYPIIVDKISNIGDKYHSQYIPVLFNNEFPQRSVKFIFRAKEFKVTILKLSLVLTLVSLLFLIFSCEPLWGWDNWLINNSAKLLVIALSVVLTVFFFLWLDRVILYNGKSSSLLTHIVKKYDSQKSGEDAEQYHLKAINELTYYAVEKQDEHLQETLLEFYYKTFAAIRKKHQKDSPLEYPVDLYFLVNNLNEEVTAIPNRKLRAIEHRAVSGVWLLGESAEEVIISEETYKWLWRNINIICDHPRLVKMFWSNSSQYYVFRLRQITQDYDYEKKEVKNKSEVEKRLEERQKFLEFHYALGGLTYYREHYDLLKYFFEYSQSQPPDYVLLPESMTEIFYWFEHFRNEFKNIGLPIDLKYYFPELDNLGTRRQVNYWICSYVTILFVRQYSLNQYYTYQDFTALPTLPDDILELTNWLDSTSFFDKCLNDVLGNDKLLATLGYEEIVIKHKEEFKKFIAELKEAIYSKIGDKKRNAELSHKMISNFYERSDAIITGAFYIYQPIFTEMSEEHRNGHLKLSVNGASTLMSKSAFTDNDISHLNYDSIFASGIASENIKRYIPNSFFLAKTKRYLLKREDLINCLQKLIGENPTVVIVGVNIQYGVREIIENSAFKKIITYIPSTQYNSQDLLFVLRKEDLPSIEHKEISPEDIAQYQLVEINSDLKVYASVIDINKPENAKIKDKWNLDNDPASLDLKVQLALSFISIIHWKDLREIVQINVTSEYREQGIPNTLNDIKPFGKDDKTTA
ncbi:hypothetical protein [Sphingobacterium siyangense]|uniref:hypothetical protein n=1 Tax=Sphingobacterium siyangense TaxID=459529 RepID=UPI001964A763|nr:hypothetical protein [Sphingobacterium siyangense]QRY55508.1 hypothetical protein JVX97_15820 [Sphingobacterium siyangense]